MASKYDFDIFVIGGGSGGVRAARTPPEPPPMTKRS